MGVGAQVVMQKTACKKVCVSVPLKGFLTSCNRGQMLDHSIGLPLTLSPAALGQSAQHEGKIFQKLLSVKKFRNFMYFREKPFSSQ